MQFLEAGKEEVDSPPEPPERHAALLTRRFWSTGTHSGLLISSELRQHNLFVLFVTAATEHEYNQCSVNLGRTFKLH